MQVFTNYFKSVWKKVQEMSGDEYAEACNKAEKPVGQENPVG